MAAESMETDETVTRHLLPVESIKIMGESVGIGNMNDDSALKMSEDLEFRLKEVVQEATKFMRHSKRRKLTCSDIDYALRAKNVEPLYGFDASAEYIPFRHTSGGGKDLYYPDDKDVALMDLISSPLPRLPSDISIRAHWLAVEGVQPVVPENPPPSSMEEQHREATASMLPTAKSGQPVTNLKRIMPFDSKGKKKNETVSTEWSKLKPLQAHTLSLEQQLYYKEITDACVGVGPEAKWIEALNSLSTDPGIYQLLPQFNNFINEGIKVCISQRKLSTLKHLVKMVGALLDNTTLSVEKYLHELIPSLLSCLIGKQLCIRPESEDHWTLRDNTAKLLAKISKKYANSINNIQSRITQLLVQALKSNSIQSLPVHYGALGGLVEMGQDTITAVVLPRLKQESALLRLAFTQQTKPTVEQITANKVQTLLLRYCAPVLLTTRSASDTLAQYQTDYGNIGQALFNQVKSLRQNKNGSTLVSRLTSPSTTSPSGAKLHTVNLLKNKPPPLNLSSPHSIGRSSSVKSSQSPCLVSVATPTLAAALQLVSAAAAKSNPGTPASVSATPSSSSLSLLSAVISSPNAAVLTEKLTAALRDGAGGGGGSGGNGNAPPAVASPVSTAGSPVPQSGGSTSTTAISVDSPLLQRLDSKTSPKSDSKEQDQ